MASWLGTWAKRKKIEIDNTNVDASLSHFPMPVFLGTSVGLNNEDTTAIFDEVGASWQKIAVTESDGTTELYVEKEGWDNGTETAVLWVSSSSWSVSNSAKTTIYIYYDSSKTDNTSYVADVGSRTEVWDSHQTMVQHMNQDPAGSAPQMIDSTSNSNDATADGGMTSGDLVSGKIDNALNFDINDNILLSDSSLQTQSITVSAWVNIDSLSSAAIQGVVDGTGPTGQNGYSLHYWYTSSRFEFIVDEAGSGDWKRAYSDSNATAGQWTHITGTMDGTTVKLYVDGVLQTVTASANKITYLNADTLVGLYQDLTFGFVGKIDEVRISNSARSAAWVKTDYYASDDNILDWYAEEDYVPPPSPLELPSEISPYSFDLLNNSVLPYNVQDDIIKLKASLYYNNHQFYDTISGAIYCNINTMTELIPFETNQFGIANINISTDNISTKTIDTCIMWASGQYSTIEMNSSKARINFINPSGT